jgi:hypothetical protein
MSVELVTQPEVMDIELGGIVAIRSGHGSSESE